MIIAEVIRSVGNKNQIKIIVTKICKTLLTNEVYTDAFDIGDLYRVPCDKRGLSYDKYFKGSDTKRNILSEFNNNKIIPNY